jgi:hypothetical protein
VLIYIRAGSTLLVQSQRNDLKILISFYSRTHQSSACLRNRGLNSLLKEIFPVMRHAELGGWAAEDNFAENHHKTLLINLLLQGEFVSNVRRW